MPSVQAADTPSGPSGVQLTPIQPEPSEDGGAKTHITPAMAFEDAPGVLGTSIHTLRKDALDAYATESLGAVALGLEDIRLSPVNKDGHVELNLGEQIQLEPDQGAISKTSRRLLDGIGRLLAENPDTKVEILVHTDDQGDAGYNLRLSQRRADLIKDYLVSRDVTATRITALGKGEDDPLVQKGRRTPTRSERAKNRRTEMVFEALDLPPEEQDMGTNVEPAAPDTPLPEDKTDD